MENLSVKTPATKASNDTFSVISKVRQRHKSLAWDKYRNKNIKENPS